MWSATSKALPDVLAEFKTRFNDNPRAKKLVTGWNRMVLLDATDSGQKYALMVQNGVLEEVRKVTEFKEGADDLVHLQGDESVLSEIFSGKYNPATALVDGAMAIFSKDKDKVKLEALAMVIWRLG
jgi:hypothetical protein